MGCSWLMSDLQDDVNQVGLQPGREAAGEVTLLGRENDSDCVDPGWSPE